MFSFLGPQMELERNEEVSLDTFVELSSLNSWLN